MGPRLAPGLRAGQLQAADRTADPKDPTHPTHGSMEHRTWNMEHGMDHAAASSEQRAGSREHGHRHRTRNTGRGAERMACIQPTGSRMHVSRTCTDDATGHRMQDAHACVVDGMTHGRARTTPLSDDHMLMRSDAYIPCHACVCACAWLTCSCCGFMLLRVCVCVLVCVLAAVTPIVLSA